MLFWDPKRVAMLVFVASIVIMLVNPFRITGQNINNLDASSYVIVPIIMLPLFALFLFKEKIEPQFDLIGIALGIAAFVAFLLLIIVAKLYFQYSFLSYRFDMLLFPIAIFSLALVLFGTRNLRRFRAIAAYSLLASPLALFSMLQLNPVFAQANSIFVYSVLHLFSSSIRYLPPFSISAGSYVIGIGEACAGIAVFVALALFMIPIAYLLEGRDRSKVYWVASGFVLLVALNLVRMGSIAGVWLLSGPDSAVSFVHSFAGILLFYFAIIAMVLLAGRYGLRFPRINKRMQKGRKSTVPRGWELQFAIALILPVLYLLVSLDYPSAINIPISTLINHVPVGFNGQAVSAIVSGIGISRGNWSVSVSQYTNSTEVFLLLYNATFGAQEPAGVAIGSGNISGRLFKTGKVLGKLAFVDSRGLVDQVYEVRLSNTVFFLSEKTLPYVIQNDSFTTVNGYVIVPYFGERLGTNCTSNYDTLYTEIAGLAYNNANASVSSQIMGAYCVASNLV
ncbi:MAG: exosortase/archaeosortase family protein [Candidatus Micrarchaeota archaeon]|nr:exosortase/archaeosortase family protein [Candidatus Micrarchaeota archaeon]MDE1848117.1 exosortase/archaeosortase family protein [Candidatus Micrarchaeota archaeon]MDE1863924.1 exosortase/archaeosortase family protein [Candidatus Micrarchaeota archaeon]